VLGKTSRIKPALTKYKHREVVLEQEGWECDVGFAAGRLWRQLSQGARAVSLFLPVPSSLQG